MIFRPRLLCTCAFALLLSGCVTVQSEKNAADAKIRMLGMPKSAVLACMGEPKDKKQEGKTEIWTYYSSDGHGEHPGSVYNPAGFALSSGTYEKSFCLVVVEMKNGVVQSLEYLGPKSTNFYNKDDQCGYAVAACVK
ncbi:MAG: hypothetical protein WC521_02885 [Bdellovibrionales bacterium]|jgi:hypothetical protein